MSFKDRLAQVAAAVGAFFEELPEEAATALPPDAQSTLTAVVNDGAAEAETLANQEIAAAEARLPAALAPFAPDLAAMVDAKIAQVRDQADQDVAKLTAAKAALAQAAT